MKYKVHQLTPIFLAFFIGLLLFSCGGGGTDKTSEALTEQDLIDFIKQHQEEVIELNQQIGMAEFNAAVTGRDEDYQQAADLNIQLTEIYADSAEFLFLKQLKESDIVKDSLLERQLTLLYNEYKFHQVDEEKMAEMIRLSTDIEKRFSRFRAEVDGKILSVNDVEDILENSRNSDELQQTWAASKAVGNLIAEDLVRLVKMRNEAARSLGFENYFEMRLILSGQNPDELAELYEGFELLTSGPYTELKQEIDNYLAKRYGVSPDELMPWHYQDRFFQNAPDLYTADLDPFYADKDLVSVADNYFNGIGLNISDVLEKSDLFPNEGKRQLASTKDVNRTGDVRIIASITDDASSMNTLLYEGGFAAYLKNISQELPYLLRTPPHFFTNDAVATLFSQFSSNPEWIATMLNVPEGELDDVRTNSSKNLRLQKFVFSRWAQVMYHFERLMYQDPDQDLNKLWWDLVEHYQLVNRPPDRDSADWATKTHIITQPCTYHNYILGELFASQLYLYLNENIISDDASCSESCINNPKVGQYLIEKVFAPGASLTWDELVANATGEKLNPDYFKIQYINVEN